MSIEHLTRRQLAKAYRFASSGRGMWDSAWYLALNLEVVFRWNARASRRIRAMMRKGILPGAREYGGIAELNKSKGMTLDDGWRWVRNPS